MFKSVVCKVAGHRVNRRRVWHDKFDFRTSCDRCGAPLIRDDADGWREFDSDRDHLAGRMAHPSSA